MTIPTGYFIDASGEPVTGATITWTIGDDATGINGITVETADGKAYTVNGVRVDAKKAKGIVIIGGKKVVKK